MTDNLFEVITKKKTCLQLRVEYSGWMFHFVQLYEPMRSNLVSSGDILAIQLHMGVVNVSQVFSIPLYLCDMIQRRLVSKNFPFLLNHRLKLVTFASEVCVTQSWHEFKHFFQSLKQMILDPSNTFPKPHTVIYTIGPHGISLKFWK